MKRHILAVAASLVLLAAPSILAAAEKGHGKAAAPHGSASIPEGADPRTLGAEIRKSQAEAFSMTYRLLKLDKPVEGDTHHLMVFIDGADGKPLAGAKVGFQVTAPGAEKPRSVMTQGMDPGFGANLNFTAKGTYLVRCKAAYPGGTFTDEFSYLVK